MRILYGTDGSKAAHNALELLLGSFAWPKDTLVDVLAVEPGGFGSGPGADGIAEANIGAAVGRCAAAGVRATGAIASGDPAEELIARAAATQPDLVLLGADRGNGQAPHPLAASIGHVASTVALNGHASVLVAAGASPIALVVLGADGSVEAERALRLLERLPFSTRPILVVTTVRDPARPEDAAPEDPAGSPWESKAIARAIAEDTAARVANGGPRPEIRTPLGRPEEQLPVTARELHADLVVVGTRGLSPRTRRRLGSVAETLLRRMPASLLIARAAPDEV